MKIARVVLTATILFSLKSTVFCSEKQTEDTIQLTRTDSGIHHDGTRNGTLGLKFGSGLDTLKNIKDKKLYGSQPYGMGSDSQAPARWTAVGKSITKLEDAQTFMAEVERVKEFGLEFSQEALQPSRDLIEAENQRLEAEKQSQFEQADSQYVTLNQQAKSLLCALNTKIVKTRKDENKALIQKYAEALKAEQTQLRDARKQEDNNLTTELVLIFNQLTSIKCDQNKIASSANYKITRLPFVVSEDSLKKNNLLKLSQKYQDWNPKITTYAQAVQSKK